MNDSLTDKKDFKQKTPVYVVVTPAFNEEKNIKATIDSIVSQTVQPKAWVIVDDGSSDKTWEIISLTTKDHNWIKTHRQSKNQNQRDDGLLLASEAEAFLEGLEIALKGCPNPDFIVKLDADLKFASDYFMALFNEYARDTELGIAGGVVYEYRGSELVREKVSNAHVRGATKVYRYACYKDIGCVRPVFGWDVIDEILARAYGWKVKSFGPVHLIHLRRTASRGGRFAGWTRNGYMAYYIGMSPLRIFLRVIFRLVTTGDITQSCGLAYGYFRNFFRRAQQLPDSSLRKLVRKHQWTTAQGSLRPQNPTTPSTEVMS